MSIIKLKLDTQHKQQRRNFHSIVQTAAIYRLIIAIAAAHDAAAVGADNEDKQNKQVVTVEMGKRLNSSSNSIAMSSIFVVQVLLAFASLYKMINGI